MKKILFPILALLLSLHLKAQEVNPIETIPLEEEIQIRINAVDSTTLDFYYIYDFTFSDKSLKARFWTPKNEKPFMNGTTTVKLCRIWEMQSNDGSVLRGHALSNTLTLMEDETGYAEFNFNEFGGSPTLQLCSTE